MSYLYLLQVILDWVVGCANHNKDLSDGECGDIQHLIDRANMAHESRETTLHSKVFCCYILCIVKQTVQEFLFLCANRLKTAELLLSLQERRCPSRKSLFLRRKAKVFTVGSFTTLVLRK